MRKARLILCVLLGVLILQGCTSLSRQCLFPAVIYDRQETARIMHLQNGTAIEVIGDKVFFPVIGNSGRMSAPDGNHMLAGGERFRTVNGRLVPLEDCPF